MRSRSGDVCLVDMINVWINDCEPSLYCSGESGLIMKTWCKCNKVNRPWKWDQGKVIHAWLTCTHHDVWTKHGEPRLYGSGEILGFWVTVVNGTFNKISVISWLGNMSTQIKPLTYRKSLSNFIKKSCIECTSRFELTTLVVIGTDSTGSWKSNYHINTAMTAPN